MTAALLSAPTSAAEAPRRSLLDGAAAERCVTQRTHLTALAESPPPPADLVERLAMNLDETVRLAVSLRPELDETRRTAMGSMAEDLDRGNRAWCVRDGLADPEAARCAPGRDLHPPAAPVRRRPQPPSAA